MPRSVFGVCALTAAALCVATCGSSNSSTPTSPSTAAATPVTITINGQKGAQSFSPNPAPDGGQMVVFRNSDSTVHHIVLNDGSVDTGNIAPDATSTAVMMPAGGTNYHCTIHPTMVGAVNASGGTAPPPCEGIYCSTAQ